MNAAGRAPNALPAPLVLRRVGLVGTTDDRSEGLGDAATPKAETAKPKAERKARAGAKAAKGAPAKGKACKAGPLGGKLNQSG